MSSQRAAPWRKVVLHVRFGKPARHSQKPRDQTAASVAARLMCWQDVAQRVRIRANSLSTMLQMSSTFASEATPVGYPGM
mmetsp:Transcript_35546/g.107257  ORF Transcript_35546/g.107257 Transcript_35546/m.107257 type:complete len:80 (-) Transcript_35546:329-568(-)